MNNVGEMAWLKRPMRTVLAQAERRSLQALTQSGTLNSKFSTNCRGKLMTITPFSLAAAPTQGSRKPYATPSLTALGSVSDLVMGAGTTRNEAGGGTGGKMTM